MYQVSWIAIRSLTSKGTNIDHRLAPIYN
jgi:hypothetical protein